MADLSVRTDFDFDVEETERLFVPAADGTRLAGRLWRPKTSKAVPVIIEMHPYRTRDLFRRVDDMNARYWAGFGYAVLRIDIRGSGDSGGLLTDEYTDREIDDGAAVIAWAKAQDWCDGAVGLTGLSWSGFTALRVATRYPEAVQALMVTGVSDDGFVTDIHHLGGAAYVGRVAWAGTMLLLNSLPPDPDSFEGDWQAVWRARLAANRSWLVPWLSHQTRDAFWQDKAVFGPNRAARTPLLVLGGMADKYKTPVLRLLARWQGHARGILGPWEHIYPQLASRQPAIGYLQEGLRWWDRWLKGRDTGVQDDPALRVWQANGDGEGGQWVALPAWPADSLSIHRFEAADTERLAASDTAAAATATPVEASGDGPAFVLPGRPRTATALPGDDPFDDAPRAFDPDAMVKAGAHILTSAPLNTELAVFSVPVLRARVRPQGDHGTLAAWLFSLAPDGSASLLTRGALNLAFATGFDTPDPVEAGEVQPVTLDCDALAVTVPAGHRLGLALAAHAWPILWPAPGSHEPEGADLMVETAGLALDLPLLPRTVPMADFEGPQIAVPDPVTELTWLTPEDAALPAPDPATHISTPTLFSAGHITATGTDIFIHGRSDLVLTQDSHPRATEHWRGLLHRPGWSVDVTATTTLTSTADTFQITWSVTARLDGETVHNAAETVSLPRRLY